MASEHFPYIVVHTKDHCNLETTEPTEAAIFRDREAAHRFADLTAALLDGAVWIGQLRLFDRKEEKTNGAQSVSAKG